MRNVERELILNLAEIGKNFTDIECDFIYVEAQDSKYPIPQKKRKIYLSR